MERISGTQSVFQCEYVCACAYMCMHKCMLMFAHASKSQCEHTQMCLNLIRPDE